MLTVLGGLLGIFMIFSFIAWLFGKRTAQILLIGSLVTCGVMVWNVTHPKPDDFADLGEPAASRVGTSP